MAALALEAERKRGGVIASGFFSQKSTLLSKLWRKEPQKKEEFLVQSKRVALPDLSGLCSRRSNVSYLNVKMAQ